ncbi:MAG: exodeoxyribonuclease V subunit gamma, partial [Candidatus Sumerlaeota bacterium]|nr:exodeoxyribonuclease V subunit gamma [Candidatus Sumerlaeota bacterium]
MASPILENLNPRQREAVATTDGPLLVIAGAGSGKTRVITHRIAYLIHEKGVPAWQIFAATFTNKAAREMRDRLARLVDPSAMARLSVSTFHSFCAALLRREAEKAGLSKRFTILDETDQRGVVKACMARLEIDPKRLTPEQALDRIGQAKIRLLGPEESAELFTSGPVEDYVNIYVEYERMLTANNAVDFDDLLLKVIRLFESNAETRAHYQERYQHLLVDEYQDTNYAQFRLVELLAGRSGNLCVVGDEDQSIYSWRGADINNLLDFQKVFPAARLVRLEQNYRSTKTILSAAHAVIEHNKERLGKELWTDGPQGESIVVFSAASSLSEADFVVEQVRKLRRAEGVRYSEMAVFFRINALSRAVEDRLRAENIPYRVVGGIRFYDRLEIKDMLAYLQAVAAPEASLALARILNKPKRGIGDKSLRELERHALEQGLTLNEAIRRDEALALVPKKARGALQEFAKQLDVWREKVDAIPLRQLVEMILDDTEYIESLGDPTSLEAITRTENIEELLASIDEFEKESNLTLLDYLERIALATSADEGEEGEEMISLMTLHSAKGLEFRVVFMIGLEEGIFPNQRALRDRGNVEEERRLFYVGVTRAKERLYVSWARSRFLHGAVDWQTSSVFLHELPTEHCQTIEQADQSMADRYGAHSGKGYGRGPFGPKTRGRSAFPRRPARQERPRVSFQVGQRVEHKFLGAGEIVDIEGHGENRTLIIRFADGEAGEILERYGDLKVVEQ